MTYTSTVIELVWQYGGAGLITTDSIYLYTISMKGVG